MNKINKTIGFIGAGNMAEAMIGAIIKAGLTDADKIVISEPSESRRKHVKAAWNIRTAADNIELTAGSDIVIFAVKPQVIGEVLSQLSEENAFCPGPARRIFISIAAGIPISRFEEKIYHEKTEPEKKQMPVLRVMPNTPALAGAGMSGLCANPYAQQSDLEIAGLLLESMGKVRIVQENQMDAVTALSGSGPAYAFYLLEAMTEAGIRLGLEKDLAADLSQSAVSGAVALIEARNLDPETLRKKVTSPGGTTQAAINVLDDNNVKQFFVSAVLAAAKRSEQLSKQQI